MISNKGLPLPLAPATQNSSLFPHHEHQICRSSGWNIQKSSSFSAALNFFQGFPVHFVWNISISFIEDVSDRLLFIPCRPRHSTITLSFMLSGIFFFIEAEKLCVKSDICTSSYHRTFVTIMSAILMYFLKIVNWCKNSLKEKQCWRNGKINKTEINSFVCLFHQLYILFHIYHFTIIYMEQDLLLEFIVRIYWLRRERSDWNFSKSFFIQPI